MAEPNTLLDEVKNYLDMTWELSGEEQSKLEGIINRGKAYLDRIAGKEQDYNKEGQAKALLMDYTRYVRSNALDEYQNNYLHELLALQMEQVIPND